MNRCLLDQDVGDTRRPVAGLFRNDGDDRVQFPAGLVQFLFAGVDLGVVLVNGEQVRIIRAELLDHLGLGLQQYGFGFLHFSGNDQGVGQVDLQYGNLFMVRPQFRDSQVQRLAREFGGADKIPL